MAELVVVAPIDHVRAAAWYVRYELTGVVDYGVVGVECLSNLCPEAVA